MRRKTRANIRLASRLWIVDKEHIQTGRYTIRERDVTLEFLGLPNAPSSTAPGMESDVDYLDKQLGNATTDWKVCVWHTTNNATHVGGPRADEAPIELYDKCREHGAIIANANEHSYSRTRTLTTFSGLLDPKVTQVVDPEYPTDDPVYVGPGKTFQFVSGFGGFYTLGQAHCLDGCKGEWATVFTNDQAKIKEVADGHWAGEVFLKLGKGNEGRGYFKTIDENKGAFDTFTIIRGENLSLPPSK